MNQTKTNNFLFQVAQILLNENPRENNVREAKLMYGDIVNFQMLKGIGVDFVCPSWESQRWYKEDDLW